MKNGFAEMVLLDDPVNFPDFAAPAKLYINSDVTELLKYVDDAVNVSEFKAPAKLYINSDVTEQLKYVDDVVNFPDFAAPAKLYINSDVTGQLKYVDDELRHSYAIIMDAKSSYTGGGENLKVFVEAYNAATAKVIICINKFSIEAKLHEEKGRIGRFLDLGFHLKARKFCAEMRSITKRLKKCRDMTMLVFYMTKDGEKKR